MGSICASSRQVHGTQPRTPRTKITLTADSQKAIVLSKAPVAYKELLIQVASRFNVPTHFLVLKTVSQGREISISDEESYANVLRFCEDGNINITVFFPSRQELAHKSLEKTITVLGEKSTSDPAENQSWGILRPVPIDVEVYSRSSVSQTYNSRDSSMLLIKSEREPRTSQCFSGHLLLFDAVTEDSFKFFGASIDEGSRAVLLPMGSIVVTGGKRHPAQSLRLDINTGSSKHMPDLSQSRHNHSTIWVQGFVWVLGGMDEHSLSSCELYDGEKWKAMPELNVPRASLSASSWGPFLYVYGGLEEASIEKYEGEAWVELSVQLAQPLALAGVYQLDENTVIVAGGVAGGDVYEVVKVNLGQGDRESLASLPITDHFTGEAVVYRDEIYFQGSLATYVYDVSASTWRCIE